MQTCLPRTTYAVPRSGRGSLMIQPKSERRRSVNHSRKTPLKHNYRFMIPAGKGEPPLLERSVCLARFHSFRQYPILDKYEVALIG